MVNKQLKEYICPWCNRNFKQWVGYIKGQGNGRRSAISDQVKCSCGNLIPTWKRINGVRIR